MKTTPEPDNKQWPLGERVPKERPEQPDWYTSPNNKDIEVNRKTGAMRTKVPHPPVWP